MHIKDDFKKGVVSQVPASWFNSVASFINNLVAGWAISLNKTETLSTIAVDPTAISDLIPSSKKGDSPTDGTDTVATVLDTEGDTWTWEKSTDNENGLNLDVYCKVSPQVAGSTYSIFRRCRLTFSKDGLLIKAELLADRIRIKATNG